VTGEDVPITVTTVTITGRVKPRVEPLHDARHQRRVTGKRVDDVMLAVAQADLF